MTSGSAIKQLVRDLKQLKQEPLIGANASPLDSNMMKWYGIVVGPEGTPYENVPIRFVLEFDDQYPNTPPKAFFDTHVRYVGGASYEVDGRLAVCLNIFGNFGHVHTEWKNMSEGWSPSYTVSTILVAMQGLMMSEMLSTDPTDIKKTIESARDFKCAITKHNGSSPKTWFPQVLLSQDDLAKYLTDNGIVRSEKKFEPLRDHYICYVKKTTVMDNAVLGYGVSVDNARIGALSSTCEYISYEAFDDGIRRSSTNKPFTHWLPILISSDRWNVIKPMFTDSILELGKSIGLSKQPEYEVAIKVCSSIMNSLVVEIMNNKNNLKANDKFVDGYFALYRLLKQLSIDEPKVIGMVDKMLGGFITNPELRTKSHVQNLGELLILLTISKKYSWNSIKELFLEECDARNVFWYAIGNFKNRALYPELADSSVVEGRADKVFKATEISRNLVMFQVKFSQVARVLSTEIMDSNCGLAPEQLRSEMKATYNEVCEVADWNAYFKWLSLPTITTKKRSEQLAEAVTRSEKQGYHTGTNGVNNTNRTTRTQVRGRTLHK